MATHTPGPWINVDGLVNGRESRPRFAPGTSIDIFDAAEWPAELHDEALANAKLIAAAPDMLKAAEATAESVIALLGELRALLRVTEDDGSQWISADAFDDLLARHAAARLPDPSEPEPQDARASFGKETYGAVVATILETDDSIVEVQEGNDGVYGLIVHTKRSDTEQWDDLTAYLRPEHFEALGSVARRMRGEAA